MKRSANQVDEGMEWLWSTFSSRLQKFILSRISDRMDAEDVLQDVFVKIHHNIAQVKNAARLESWVFQIARNAIADYWRKRKRFVPSREETAEENDAAGNGAEEAIAAGLREMAAALPPRYYQALTLVDFEGMSQLQLAQKLGLSHSGAKSRVQRARRMLKNLLLDCCHFEFDLRGTIVDYHPISCRCCRDQ